MPRCEGTNELPTDRIILIVGLTVVVIVGVMVARVLTGRKPTNI